MSQGGWRLPEQQQDTLQAEFDRANQALMRGQFQTAVEHLVASWRSGRISPRLGATLALRFRTLAA
jgi:hypothetical protein